jgi:PadR family transcriptional regulator PadR
VPFVSFDELHMTHLQELRRGTVVLACLLILKKPEYGYALLDRLERGGIAVDANTLYPLLRRLAKQGLLTSDWNTEEARPRKFYRTSKEGIALAEALRHDWDQLQTAFRTLKDVS